MKANINYSRVLPRDLFNEAKLLKSLGRLCLLILDRLTPCKMEYSEPEQPFKIGLCDDGFLTVTNVQIIMEGQTFIFRTNYNSKRNYPLYLTHEYCDYLVFDEQGEFDEEFLSFCKWLKTTAPA